MTKAEIVAKMAEDAGITRGNPNIRAMNRQMATYENDQYQFSKKISENGRSA